MDLDSPVLHRDLVELKDWLFATFVTNQTFQDFKREMYDFRQEMYDFRQEVLGFKDESLSRFDSLFGTVADIKQEQIFMNQALRRIEAKLGI